MERMRNLLRAAALLAAFAAPAWSAPADASFGDTVTGDVTLTGDISGSGSGLVVGASNITIDLNGYSITSTDGTGYGIDNTGGYDGVTIRNGSIEGFQEGIRSEGGDDLKLQDLTVEGASGSGATTGVIHVLASSGLVLEGSTVSVTAVNVGPHAVRLDSVTGVVVRDVHVGGGFIGVSFFSVDPDDDPTNGVIKDCLIENCVIGVMLANTTDAVVKDNLFRDAAAPAGVAAVGTQGVRIGFGIAVSNVEVVGNEMHDVGIGVLGWASGLARISDITVKDNHCHDNNRGLLFVDMDDSVVKDNDAHDNDAFGLAFNACDDNEIVGNKANDNGLRGLVLVFGSDGNLIKGNQVNGNTLDGIALLVGDNVGNTIKDNEALDNGVWDLFHNSTSTPNSWIDNEYDTASGADIE